MIYGCYGVWHSTLELSAREQQAHASSYRRYDDNLDDTFSPDDDLYPQDREDGPYQGWSAPEEKGHRHQNQSEDQEGEQEQRRFEEEGDRYGYQSGAGVQHPDGGSRSKGRTNFGFDDEDD